MHSKPKASKPGGIADSSWVSKLLRVLPQPSGTGAVEVEPSRHEETLL